MIPCRFPFNDIHCSFDILISFHRLNSIDWFGKDCEIKFSPFAMSTIRTKEAVKVFIVVISALVTLVDILFACLAHSIACLSLACCILGIEVSLLLFLVEVQRNSPNSIKIFAAAVTGILSWCFHSTRVQFLPHCPFPSELSNIAHFL